MWLPNEAVAKAWMEYVKTGTVADTTPPPAPSRVRVLEKAGFVREGRARRYLKINGVWQDHDLFALLQDDLRR